ncbi:MAG: aspartate--tRNA ligase [Candidatus Harrisonbacteria bacterium CG10_big_fil_rev_8_21_14_0_10_44_23]|uniref:Aspartate--tRNA ligase n=1 Tax=Candidatus Harrisonbacteria bacterium CG10_big_fil_rev_8_21_14_0_10_44_23 TaxID=1974585 RepID=A0A2H0UPV6_9BACT|nr:MAG: aspartate--tRNA ligase [Candidatus Harrisonbacteria bacterium CG10_big_fil_rev_8_21_14_0_10_44_23]
MRTLIKDTPTKVGEKVELSGWVDSRRDHGKLIFIDLRDRTGVIQAVITPKSPAYETAQKLRDEWVVKVVAEIKERPENMRNEDLATGSVEAGIEELEILNEAETPAIPIHSDGHEIDEEVRAKYRYIDLKRERLQKNIKLRSEFVRRVREFLFSKEFNEIETPMLTQSTAEGSRDFVVPSRLHPGKFFALPQSPQQYKQLLMTAGFERYFQLARCIRDEDLRADRGFEHTQVDIEMSFVDREEFMKLDEEMITTVCEAMGYTIKEKPFPRISYKEAMEKYGADKFDLRTEEDKKNGVLAFAWVTDFPFFEKDGDGWTFSHNPFSAVMPDSLDDLMASKNIENIISSQYDLVCNGYETGGGSIRAHKSEWLEAALKIMGFDEEKIKNEYGHMLDAFKAGTPPHGGIAHGVERMIMILTGEKYLREVQAFPQTSSGKTSVMDAPRELSEKQLDELKIKIDKKD